MRGMAAAVDHHQPLRRIEDHRVAIGPAIKVDVAARRASGWAFKEDNKVAIDLAEGLEAHTAWEPVASYGERRLVRCVTKTGRMHQVRVHLALVTEHRAELAETLADSAIRVSLVAERNTAVQLAFSDGVLTLDAGSGDEAQASESIEASVQGDDITTGFNPQFLLDGLTALESPVVEMAFTQPSKPAVMAGVDSLDGEADRVGDPVGVADARAELTLRVDHGGMDAVQQRWPIALPPTMQRFFDWVLFMGDQAQATAGTVTPIPAMGPCR